VPTLAQRLLIPAVALGVVVVGLIGLDRSPITAMDEVFYVEPARMLATRGQLIAPLFAGLRGLSEHYFLHPPGLFLAQALVFIAFGFGKWQARLPGLLEYGASTALVAAIVVRSVPPRSWRHWLAAGAAILFACDAGVIQSYRIARPDIQATLLALLSLWILVRAAATDRSNNPTTLFLAGLCAGASAMTYFAMIEVLPGALLGALLGSKSIRENVRRGLFWGVGCAIPLAAWGIFILRSPHAFHEQFLKHVSDISRIGGAEPRYLNLIPVREGPAEPWTLGAFLRILSHWSHFEIMPLGFLAFVTLLASGAKHVRGPGRIVLAFMVSAMLLLLNGRSLMPNVVAFMYLGTAVCLAAGWEAEVPWIRSKWARVFFIATPLSYLPIPLARAATTVAHWKARSGEPLNELVRRDIPPGVPVAGVPAAYFAAVANGDDYYYATPLTGLLVYPQPGDLPQFTAAMEKIRPQYLLVDPAFDPLTAPGLPREAHYERIDRFTPPSVNIGSIKRTGYDLVVWKVRYD
jgi:4-amino-4-deoxy-L-arabinose transferase-like glycosyltransferase